MLVVYVMVSDGDWSFQVCAFALRRSRWFRGFAKTNGQGLFDGIKP